MHNQFFYTIEEKDGKKVLGSFNLNHILRTFPYDDANLDKIMVILDDFREQVVKRPKPVGKNGKMTQETVRDTVWSEIFLNEEDSNRFRIATGLMPDNLVVAEPTITSNAQEVVPS